MSNFDKAFAKARASGAKEFSFGGKAYNTKLKSDAPAKKKSTLPKTAPAPKSRSSAVSDMSTSPSYSSLTEAGKKMPVSPKKSQYDSSTSNNSSMGDGTTSVPSPDKSHSFFPVKTGTNRSQLNDFRQSESRRASDEATGYANRPKVKRAIGKFMLGKGYSD